MKPIAPCVAVRLMLLPITHGVMPSSAPPVVMS